MIRREVECGEEIASFAACTQAQHRRGAAAIFAYASGHRFDDDAREAGWKRKVGEMLHHAAVGADAVEKEFGALDGIGRWGVEPVEIGEVCEVHRTKSEQELREVGAGYLGSVAVRAKKIIFLRVEAQNLAGSCAAGSSGSLRGGR